MQPSMMTKQNLKGEVLTLLMFRILLQLNPKQLFLVQFCPFYLLQSTSVHFGLTRSVRSYSIYFDLIQSYPSIWCTSVHSVYFGIFRPLRSYSVHFSPIRTYSFQCDPFSPLGPIRSTSVQIGLIRSHTFHSVYLVQFSLFQSARSLSSYSVQFGPSVQLVQFGPHLSIWFTSVQFGLIRSFSVNFGPLRFIQSTFVHSVHFGLIGP